MSKKIYRIRNWRDYNKALVARGSLTIWLDEKSLAEWHRGKRTGKRGRPFYYGDLAIECSLTIRTLFRLPLRAIQGLMCSLIAMLKASVDVPNYTTLCRRQSKLDVKLPYKVTEPLHLVVDSSGMKLYGEGEWKVKIHGKSKRRTWRKIHIGVDTRTHNVIVAKVTTGHVHDAPVFSDLIDQLPTDVNINQVSGDGAYDSYQCYKKTLAIKAKPNFPPKANSKLKYPQDAISRHRNYTFMSTHCRGKEWWAKKTNYHQRSPVETAFFRLKKLFGDHVSSYKFTNQVNELLLRCRTLNLINQLGMPDSYPIT